MPFGFGRKNKNETPSSTGGGENLAEQEKIKQRQALREAAQRLANLRRHQNDFKSDLRRARHALESAQRQGRDTSNIESIISDLEAEIARIENDINNL